MPSTGSRQPRRFLRSRQSYLRQRKARLRQRKARLHERKSAPPKPIGMTGLDRRVFLSLSPSPFRSATGLATQTCLNDTPNLRSLRSFSSFSSKHKNQCE